MMCNLLCDICPVANETTNKVLIDGEEGVKTPAAQQSGLETQRTKVPEEESCSLPSCLHPP